MKNKFILACVFVALLGCSKESQSPILADEGDFQSIQTLPATVLVGEVTYRQRIALPTPYTVELELYELEGKNRITIGEVQTLTVDHQVPVSFIFSYDAKLIDRESKNYGMEARIYSEDNQLSWRNNDLVDPFALPLSNLTIIVNQVN